MKIIKKYTAIEFWSHVTNNTVSPQFSYGEIEGPYYDREYPQEIFDSEEEAIEYWYSKNPYGKYLILPVVSFGNN